MKDTFRDYFTDIKNTLDKIDLEHLETFVQLLLSALDEGRQIFTMGNGGSGTTASHLVCDLNKGVCFGQEKKFKAICLNDNLATVLAYANDVSYSSIFSEQLKNFLQSRDVVIAFSGSGNSENVLNAVEYANAQRAVTVGFTGYDGGKLAKIVQLSILAPVRDMQKAEDAHIILSHLVMQILQKTLKTNSC